MISVNYNLSINPSVAETYLTNSEFGEGQFFIKKHEGLLSLMVEYKDELDFSSEIYSINKTANKIKVTSNTVDVIATNILVDNVAYYYKLTSLGRSLDYNNVILNSSIDCVSYKGSIYTNEIVINREISPGLYVHSIPVINHNEASVKYRSNDIELTYPSSLGDLHFKCKSETIISPILINNCKVHIPSFYIKGMKKTFKCIEGDIQLLSKKELTYFVGNSISCKDYIHSYDSNFYNSLTNNIYLPHFNYKTTPALIEYTAKMSSHIFRITKEKLYFKINKNGLTISTKDDYDFVIKKVIDMSKIDVIASNHLSTYQHTLTPSDFVIVQDISNDEDSNVSFKKQIKTNLNKFPSEQVYLEYRNRYILQHTNSMLQTSNPQIEEDIYTDTIQSFTTPSTIYDDYRFVKIGSTYYYKNSDSYYAVFLFEEDSPFLLEDALNFILEF